MAGQLRSDSSFGTQCGDSYDGAQCLTEVSLIRIVNSADVVESFRNTGKRRKDSSVSLNYESWVGLPDRNKGVVLAAEYRPDGLTGKLFENIR